MAEGYPFLKAWRAAHPVRGRLHRSAPGWIAFTPLADVVLLVVLFLMHHSAWVVRPGLFLRLPEAPFMDGAAYGTLVVTVSQEGMSFFRDERTTLDGLGPAFAQAAREYPRETLIIEADGRVAHETLVEIYNRAMLAGIRDVALATRLGWKEKGGR